MNYLQSYQFGSRKIPLMIDSAVDSTKNVYTVLIGENGTGKSRLLADMVVKFTNKDDFYNHKVGQPNVIAASTSPFDIFPRENKKMIYGKNYSYIGMKRNGFAMSSPLSLMSSAMIGIIEKYINNENYDELFHVFSILGFSPNLTLNYRSNFKFREQFDLFSKGHGNLEELLGIDISTPYSMSKKQNLESYDDKAEIVTSFEVLRSHGFDFSTFSMDFNLSDNSIFVKGVKSTIEYVKSIFVLIKNGFIRLLDVKLDKLDTGLISLRRASSGEQCMLMLMLGIAANISDNSIILIDEPEISLHPKWQENFMPLLMSVFSGYQSCQFIIASHSPQIVSNVSKNNCFVTSISKGSIYESSYFYNRSSDFQLAELFDAPGNKNEYITRLCFSLLSKVKDNRSVDDSDLKSLNKIMSFIPILEDKDPLLDLVLSVKEVVTFYASN
ncbi:TPA: ATP-binding protein [Vibrio parahaemolyticus]|nr:ATP-binding protein [Vibrio parahaemolyticus]